MGEHAVQVGFSSPNLHFDLISPDDEAALEEAARLDSAAWGEGLGFEASVFAQRARNGYLLGAFDRSTSTLQGTLSALRVPRAAVDALDHEPSFAASWHGVTGGGTFSTHHATGDVLLCVAVTARGASRRPPGTSTVMAATTPLARRIAQLSRALRGERWWTSPSEGPLFRELARWTVRRYLLLDLDYVIRFHRRPKPHVHGGAHVWRVVPDGRPDDLDAMGYNVVLAYPPLDDRAGLAPVDEPLSVGVGLVTAAYDLGLRLPGVRFVAPYSRPAGFRRHLVEALDTLAASTTPLEHANTPDDFTNYVGGVLSALLAGEPEGREGTDGQAGAP